VGETHGNKAATNNPAGVEQTLMTSLFSRVRPRQGRLFLGSVSVGYHPRLFTFDLFGVLPRFLENVLREPPSWKITRHVLPSHVVGQLKHLIGCLYYFRVRFVSALGNDELQDLFDHLDVRVLDKALLDKPHALESRLARSRGP